MAVSICFVPLTQSAMPVGNVLTQHLVAAWPSLPAVEECRENERTLSFDVGLASVILAEMPAGIPWSDLEGPCATAMLWPDASATLRDHPAHLIVTVSGELDEIAMSTLLTQVTTSILAVLPEASGVYWGNATKLIRRDLFIDFTQEILPHGPPLHLWIDYRVGNDGDKLSTGFTHGMRALGFMEFEAKLVPEPPGELMERFMGLGSYLIENGMVINDGDTIGEDANEKIRIVFSKSEFGHDGQVMRLVYEQASPAKPWWKLW